MKKIISILAVMCLLMAACTGAFAEDKLTGQSAPAFTQPANPATDAASVPAAPAAAVASGFARKSRISRRCKPTVKKRSGNCFLLAENSFPTKLFQKVSKGCVSTQSGAKMYRTNLRQAYMA